MIHQVRLQNACVDRSANDIEFSTGAARHFVFKYAQHGREFVGCGAPASLQSPVFSSGFSLAGMISIG